MNQDRFAAIERVCHAALERASCDRGAFLDEACMGNATLRAEVESLLAERSRAEGFLEAPAAPVANGGRLRAGTRLGPYEIDEMIGAGGMGDVYRARDTRLGRTVAIKVLSADSAWDPERRRRFEHEARAVSALNHPHISVLHDIGRERPVPADRDTASSPVEPIDFLVMEYLEGKTLADRLREGRMPISEAIRAGREIADALAAAHEKGIVHRDLKPANVFLTKDGRVKILDFGIAKVTGRLTGDAGTVEATVTATAPGVVVGTVGYMSPEQVQGHPLDARSDLFSLGVVLYEMLSGQKPFHRDTAPETLAAILREEPPALSERNRHIPSGVDRIVQHCLAKDPVRRVQSARDIVLELEALTGLSGMKPPAPRSAAGALLRRHRAAVTIGALLVVAALGSAWWWTMGPGSVPGLRRLAVLPFENLSGDPEQEYLTDGLTHEMIAQLGALHPASLSVIARTSVMQYKKTRKTVEQIGRELAVDYVLEGSARRDGSRLRITAELIEVRRQSQLWAHSFEREMSNILALESQVSREVAGALALRLLPGEQARLARDRSVNPEAYEAYLKGLHHWYKLTADDLEASQRYFEQSLAKDPNYALAYGGMALVWAGRSQMGFVSPVEAGPKIRAAALKAIELDDSVAETHFTLATFRAWCEWDWASAEREFQRAIELNPSYPDAPAYYSHLLMHLGRPEEAMRQIRRALQLDPFNSLFHSIYGVDLVYVRRYDDAIGQARVALQTAPNDPVATSVLWWAFQAKAMYAEALSAARATLKILYGDPAVDRALEQGYQKSGYPEAMKRAAEALVAHSVKSFTNPTDIGVLFAHAGEKSRALDWLERAYAIHDQNMPYIGLPIYDSLRQDPRYQALLRRVNLTAR